MSRASIEFKGIEKVVMNLSLSSVKVKDAVKFALEEAGGNLLLEANKIVPFDKGTLQNSGAVTPVNQVSNDVMEVQVGYNTPYAARVHEHPEFRFQHGRQGKYLETPLKRNAKIYTDGIAKKVRSSLEGAI